MTPLVPWSLIGTGVFFAACGIKNRSPKATVLAVLSGKTSDVAWFNPPNYEAAGKALGYLGPVTGNDGTDAGAIAGGAVISATGARGVITSFAQAQLGERYVFGASGPDQWDCSGLTMKAYQQVGIKLPHHAASQQQKGREVTKANALPGDLVFWGPVSGHVAMWLGNNKVIHAPHTGDVVKISTLWDEKHARFRTYL